MPTGVVMLVYVGDYLGGAILADAGAEMMRLFGLSEEDFPGGGPLVYLPREDYDLAHVEGEPGFLLDVNLHRAYYGVGYERGDLPLFVRLTEWLEQRFLGCRVFYGHDVTGEGFPFGEAERSKLMNYYAKVGHDPYYRKDLSWEQKQQYHTLYEA